MHKINITSVFAADLNNLIGDGDKLPFKQKEDMKRFVQTTKGGIVIIGRKTFETFGKRPLKGRPHFIITSNENYLDEILPEYREQCKLFKSVNEVITHLTDLSRAEKELNVFVIGGSRVYSEMLPYVNTIKITKVLAEIKSNDPIYVHEIGNEFEISENEIFHKNKDNEFTVLFQTYKRK